MRARTQWLVVASPLIVTSALLAAASSPPRTLKYVDGHWTAWDPPAQLPEGAQVHRVERGDTFWDLASKYLGNPYLWPQIWEKNQYVLDAHWIYPGDPLVIALPSGPASPLEPVSAVGAETGQEGESAVEAAPAARPARELLTTRVPRRAPEPLAGEDDIYCSGFIGALDEPLPFRLIRSEFDDLQPRLASRSKRGGSGPRGVVPTTKVELSVGDLVYLDGGFNAGLGLGQLLTVVEPRSEVFHPLTGASLGRLYAYRGRVRVVSVYESEAVAEIVHGCSGIRVGMLVRPFVPEPVPLARRTTLRAYNDLPSRDSLEGAPVILGGPEPRVSIGQHHVVFIDRGEDQDVLAGDIFTVYRVSQISQTPVLVGEVAVISSQRNTALAKVLESRYPIFAGDRLERK